MPPTTTPHEDRFLAILQHALQGAEVAQEVSIPRKARRLDAVTRLANSPELFGALGSTLQHRTVMFEHESAPLTGEAVASAAVGQAWLRWHHLRKDRRRPAGVRRVVEGTPRPPVCVVVADSLAADVSGSVPGLRACECAGVWATPFLDEGGLIVLDSSQLVGSAGFEFWAWLGGAPTPAAAAERYGLLLDNLALSTLTRTRLSEAIMNQEIPATPAERETNAQRFRRETLAEGRKAELLELLSRYAPESYAVLKHEPDIDVLKAALDEVFQRNASVK